MPDSGGISALSAALAAHAEIGIARAMQEDASGERLKHFISNRLSGLSSDELDQLMSLAQGIIDAADYIDSLNEVDDIDPSRIPTNPELFGDEWQGKRLFWFGEWNIPGTDEWYRFSGTLPDITDFQDIRDYAAELALDYIDAYPTRFGATGNETSDDINIRILGTEKGF